MQHQSVYNEPVRFLLVEDNPADVRLIQEAFKDVNVRHELHVARDGVEAMEFLKHQGEFQNAPVPDLILLDLNMPRKDGREVLAEVKKDKKLRCIPVVVLSTSSSRKDISAAYENYASCYIKKPLEFPEFVEVVEQINRFWLTTVRLPKDSAEEH